jgi:HEAT repeat protein
MNTKQINRLRKRLENRLPLIGRWLRYRAVCALADDSSPQAISALAEALSNDDSEVREIAFDAVNQITQQSYIDAVCEVWVRKRQPELAKFIAERKWVAETPAYVKVLSALQADVLSILSDIGIEAALSFVSALQDKDAHLSQQARKAINRLKNQKTCQAIADELCSQWFETRSPVLEEVMVSQRLVAQQPLNLRILSALKTKQPHLLAQTGAEIIAPLLRACDDADGTIAKQARLALQHLKNPESREAVCRLVIEQDIAIAREAAIAGKYTPRDERLRALFFFLTDQWEPYENFDFDYSLLRSIYDSSDAALRQRITEKLRAAGRTDFLTVVVGSDFRARAAMMTPDETRFLVQMFEDNREWAKLWALLFELPFAWGARIIAILARSGWTPDKDDEQETLAELYEMVSADMVVSSEEMNRYLPPAVRRAYARVKGRVNDVAFSPVAQVLAIGTGSRKVVLWNYHHGMIERTLDGFGHSIGRVVFMPDGSLLCAERTNSYDVCAIHCFRNGRSFKLAERSGSVTALEPANETLAFSSGRDYRIALLDTENGHRVAEKVLEDWARAARVSADGRCVALLGKGVELISLPQLQVIAETQWRWDGIARTAAFAPDGESLIVGNFNGEVLVCRRNKKWLHPERQALVHHNGQAQGVEVLAERKIIITAGSDGTVQFISWENRALIGRLQIASQRLTSLRVSPDGSFMAIGDSDSSMSLWDLRVLDVPMMFARPLARAVPVDLAAINAVMSDASLDPRVRQALRFLECLLRHRFRYEIEIDDVPTIQAGEFDIEIEG